MTEVANQYLFLVILGIFFAASLTTMTIRTTTTFICDWKK